MTKRKSKKAPTDESAALRERLLREFRFDDAGSLWVLDELCRAVADLRAAQAQIAKDGLVLSGSRNQPRPHPLLSVVDQLRRTILAHVRALRITLSDEVL